ncbi:MAG: hypothetical protein EBW87_03950 [Burkholderiaceae bacterium]|nr:hypothetical protein [Burkholderiaceae bacterium]
MAERTPRELDTREKFERPKQWMPPELLPTPNPEAGYAFRWIRVSTLGTADPMNISSKLREGWEPVKASAHPEIQLMDTGNKPRFPDSIEVGGLILCKTPVEFVDQRNSYYQRQTDGQMQSVDNAFMRENDPRMPVFKERRSEVKFGRG